MCPVVPTHVDVVRWTAAESRDRTEIAPNPRAASYGRDGVFGLGLPVNALVMAMSTPLAHNVVYGVIAVRMIKCVNSFR